MEELYNQVIEAVHGQVKIKTPFGDYNGIGPDAWIEKAFEGRQVTGWQILAIVLFCFGIPARPISKEDEIKLFYKWKIELDAAVRRCLIYPYDPVTLLKLKSKPKDYNWVVPVEAADIFMDSVGHDTKISYMLEKLYKEYLANIGGSSIMDKPEDKGGAIDEKPLSTRERTAYLNIIGAMLELIKSPRPGRDTDAAVIEELVENYKDKYGISESNLNRKFPEAKRSLSAS